MNKDAIVIDGQKAQENVVPVETAAANDAMQKTGISETAGFASTKIKNMISAPDFRSGDGFSTTEEIEKRKNIAWAPEFMGQSAAYDEEFTSDTGTIIADSVKQFGMSLLTLGDKAQIALGGIASKLTGGAIGEEMRDRAYESLEAATYNISMQNTHAADAETLTAAITQGAASMLEMIATGLMTGGLAPLAQMGIEVMGDGTYNNMIAYAKENGGSIEGYEGNWGEIGIDLLNAAVQVGIERKLGLGSGRFLKRTGGHFLKEAIEGAAQEGSQAYLTDLGEWIKDNAEAPTNWENYIVSAAIGGVLQGALGAATYKNARLKADAEMAEMFFQAKKRKTPDRDEDEMRKEARSDGKQFNDDIEDGIVKDGWEEFANRVDTNNDRGIVRDNLVKEFTKARVAALGLESENDLDADDIADIQDAATIAAAEAFRESVINGVSIMDTLTARLVADGNKLVVRDLKPEERGIAERRAVDLDLEAQTLGESIGEMRHRAMAVRLAAAEKTAAQLAEEERLAAEQEIAALEEYAREEVRVGEEIGKRREALRAKFDAAQIEQWEKQYAHAKEEQGKTAQRIKKIEDRLIETGKKKRPDGYTAKQIENNIRSATDEQLREFVREEWGYNTRRMARASLVDLALKNKVKWKYIEPKKRESGEEVMKRVGMRQDVLERFSRKEDEALAYFSGVPLSAIEKMSDAEYDDFKQTMVRRFQEEEDIKNARVYDGLDDLSDIPFQDSLQEIISGKTSKKKRGAYDPRYQEIILNKDSDISTILHELSHMWLNNWFKAYRSENAPESFKKWWKPVEKALGIRESDRFLNKDASEKFARGFEKWVMDGGKGGADSLQPVYDRLSKRLADIYDDLATRYFDMVADLKPEVNAWFAQNEYVADGMVVDLVDEEGVPTGETTRMEPTRNRAAERKEAMEKAESAAKMESTAEKQAEEINNIIEGEQPALAPTTDEPAKSIYTSEGKKEHKTSRTIRDMASAEGILVDVRNEYDPHLSKRAAEDAAALVKANYDWAVEIALGRQNPPRDLPREVVFVAVRNAALARKDAITLNLLAQSPVIKDVSAAAQKLALMKNYTGNGESNIPKILSDLARLHEEKLTEKDKAEIAASVERINKLIEQADLNYEDTWNNILNDNECK